MTGNILNELKIQRSEELKTGGGGISRGTLSAGLLAMILVGLFILVNHCRAYRDAHQTLDPLDQAETGILPAAPEGKGKRLAFHDFESGDAADTASHLAIPGFKGKQSLRLSSKVPFSPGLWIRFKDLRPGDSAWIRATGYVWFSCPVAEAKCSLVATCNHNGINYKYLFVPVEKQDVKPGRWNRISIDYRIPPAPDHDDVLQVYFWYRGSGEMLVDDIEVDFFEPEGQKQKTTEALSNFQPRSGSI